VLKLDSSKARTRLGWSPRLSFDEALALTADWYREFHAAPARAAELLDTQISSYMTKLDG
jgi:CDP-glucose 4,6-dehydratase